MANDKEIIKKLLSIANKQQKIITKLAQEKSNPDTPPPQNLQPNQPRHMLPVAALKAKVQANQALKGAVVQIEADNSKRELVVTFAPGKSAANWQAVLDAKKAAEADQTLPAGWAISGKETA